MKISQLKNTRAVKAALISIAAVLVFLVLLCIRLLLPDTIYKGVMIDNIDLSGMSRAEAREVIGQRARHFSENERIVLKYGDTVWSFALKEISFAFETEQALNEAFNTARTGNIFERMHKVLLLRFKGRNIELQPSFKRSKLLEIIDNIKLKIDKKEKNASVIYQNGSVIIGEEVTGRLLDVDSSLKLVENCILEGNFKAIDLVVEERKPEILSDEIDKIDSVLASFLTGFNSNDADRTQNLKISCDKISGTILFPGEVFSMNERLGPRTVENGFKEAKIIYKSEYINGVGGGVCQITTTLYNAVLKARLKVVERTHHTLPSLYVGPGQDATIAEDYIDFKFKNDQDYPVCINASIVKNQVVISILGKQQKNKYTVRLIPDIIEEYPPSEEEVIIDNSVPDNSEVIVQKPKNGYRAVLYREVYDENNKLILKEKISDDIYKPLKAQVKVNQTSPKAKKAEKG